MFAPYAHNELNIFYSAFNQRRITILLKITQLLFTWSTLNLVKFSMLEVHFLLVSGLSGRGFHVGNCCFSIVQ